MPQLCTAAGGSQRALQYAFREIFNLTPTQFLWHMRLHAVRRERAPDPDGT